MRPLSVGDYLWVLRKIDGTELVLEWIVERKTWNDLHQSIRSGRYEEQKQRLCRSPMKNRVYLVEGPLTTEFSATLYVIIPVTLIFQITGMKFDHFQELSKKTHVDTVKDMWIRQLMVGIILNIENTNLS
ncbi:unnamed protein product [Angiostrongylus costaricensis]|uniref:Crossover junction endonuclease MUS81 n=1 Tax=Angiostrongylus costaricensis TaxID=334426 RepID=A0A0R3Q2Q0_ANGCS|nr:unnamed protein product [Angiostrongylus costaricensis]